MPDTFIRFSDMKDSHPSPIDGANDLLAIAHKDTSSSTGYNSMTVTPNGLGAHAVEDQTFVNMQTTAKTVEGAINELNANKLTVTSVTGTLVAGQTQIVLSNAAITTNSHIEVWANAWGVNPTNVVATNGSVTITFEAQQSDLGVEARVS